MYLAERLSLVTIRLSVVYDRDGWDYWDLVDGQWRYRNEGDEAPPRDSYVAGQPGACPGYAGGEYPKGGW